MKQLHLLRIGASLFSLLLFLSINGCAPVFSEMQDARTVGKNNVEGTASFSSVGFTNEGESDHVQNHVGFQAAYGLSDAVDLRLRYAFVKVDDDVQEDITVNVLAIGPKVSLIKDRLSVYLPVGFAFGEEIEAEATWQIHPPMVGTIPVVDNLDINPSVKVLVPFEEGAETTIAFNIGLGIRLNESFVLRPEFGMLFNAEEWGDGHYKQFGLGVTFHPPRKTN
jgi:hypothetical protein